MKKLYIYCDGGFGNRYGTLLGGLHVATYHNMHPIIIWRNTPSCRLSLDKIFINEFNVIDEPLDNFSDCILMMHEDFIRGKENYNINSFDSIDNLPIGEYGDYLYNNNWIPEWMDENSIVHMGKNLLFLDSIKHFSDMFAKNHGIDKFTIGVHLRATDFNTYTPKFDKEYKWIEQQPEQKFFVLSDDLNIEKKFNKLDNVVVRRKEHYVEKENNEGGWCGNIERSEESVMDALIDLTILSKTNIIVNSLSSFLKTSLLLQKIHG